jgi:glutathione S-transferase
MATTAADAASSTAPTLATPPIITAYTADVSICSQICRLAIHEHGLEVEHVNVDIECKMENYEAWFARIQPSMTVPVMKYNDEIVGDSKDILYFLAERHPGLYPEEKRQAIDEFINRFYSIFHLIGGFTFSHLVKTSPQIKDFIAMGKNITSNQKLEKMLEVPDVVEYAQNKLDRRKSFNLIGWAETQDCDVLCDQMKQIIDIMENYLSIDRIDNTENRYLLGDQYTLADIVATAFCARLHFIKGPMLFTPNVAIYWEQIKQRPSFKQAYICSNWEDSLMSQQVKAYIAGEDPTKLEFHQNS